MLHCVESVMTFEGKPSMVWTLVLLFGNNEPILFQFYTNLAHFCHKMFIFLSPVLPLKYVHSRCLLVQDTRDFLQWESQTR